MAGANNARKITPPPLPTPNAEEAELSRECRIHRIKVKRAATKGLPPPPRPLLNWRTAVPLAGAIGLVGKQNIMEDAVSIKPSLCSPLINNNLPLHFFAVFDGHGGTHFAQVCRRKMYKILKEELMGDDILHTRLPPGIITDEKQLEETWEVLMTRVFARTEAVALLTCDCGSECFRCKCERKTASFAGTTAVAVVVTEKHYVVANCGDSRAVLSRSGKAIPLSFDHKPDRPDEKRRVIARGGRVWYSDTARVQGMIAVTRAIGDMFLKPVVTSEPEMSFVRRHVKDELLIIASDGMWDVIPNEMAARVASTCLKEPEPEGVFNSRCSSAAALLSRIAYARGSSDNISVAVVDLTRDAAAPSTIG